MVVPGSSMPTVVALTARSADRSACLERGVGQRHRGAGPRPTAAEPLDERERRRRRPVADRHPARAGAADRRTRPRGRRHRPRRRRRRHPPAAGPSRARRRPGSPGASVLKPTSRPSSVRTTLLTAPIVAASASTSSTRPATTRLYGAVTPSPSQSGPRAARDGAGSTASGSSSSEDVARVDPGRVERRVVHDLRVAPLQRLADQARPGGSRADGRVGGRRTGPAVAGNVTFGMISSTQSPELGRVGRHRVQDEVLDAGVDPRLERGDDLVGRPEQVDRLEVVRRRARRSSP